MRVWRLHFRCRRCAIAGVGVVALVGVGVGAFTWWGHDTGAGIVALSGFGLLNLWPALIDGIVVWDGIDKTKRAIHKHKYHSETRLAE